MWLFNFLAGTLPPSSGKSLIGSLFDESEPESISIGTGGPASFALPLPFALLAAGALRPLDLAADGFAVAAGVEEDACCDSAALARSSAAEADFDR